jgi:hypothetical protein
MEQGGAGSEFCFLELIIFALKRAAIVSLKFLEHLTVIR